MKKFLKNIFIIIFVFIISNSGGFMESEANDSILLMELKSGVVTIEIQEQPVDVRHLAG